MTAVAALKRLTQWERNFLVLYSRGGADEVLTELSINADQIEPELTRIRAKLEKPVPLSAAIADAAGIDPDDEPDPGQVDDFGGRRPAPKLVGPRMWQPVAPIPCATCQREFWPNHPRTRYCADHKTEASRRLATPPTPPPAAPDPVPADDLGRQVAQLAARVDALTAQLEHLAHVIEGDGLDVLDITLGAVVRGLARIGANPTLLTTNGIGAVLREEATR